MIERIAQRAPKSFFLRMCCVLLIVILLSGFVSFGAVMPFLNVSLSPTIRSIETDLATTILRLDSETNATTDILSQTFNGATMKITVLESLEESPLHISEHSKRILERDGYVYLSAYWVTNSVTVVKVSDAYLLIGLVISGAGFVGYQKLIATTLVVSLIITAFVIAFFIKRLTSPLTKLSRATNEIAKGNFDVQVPIEDEERTDELSQLIYNFNRMARELGNIEFLRKDFVNSVSHEFKTPIASIQGFATMLKDDDLSKEEHDEFTDIIIDESKRLSKLSVNILRLAKLDSQEFIDKTEKYSLDEQLRDCILLLEPEWIKKEIQFNIELDEVEFTSDEELLKQVWLNIIGNAVKFCTNGGEITVKLTKTEQSITVVISDNGIGMSAETSQRIFEKFYQGDREHTVDGNGLGLSIAKRIVDLAGGKIVVTSKLGEGTTFIVKFPTKS